VELVLRRRERRPNNQGLRCRHRHQARIARQQAGAFYNRGVAHRNQGQLEQALQDYSQSIRLNPAGPDVFYNRGVAEQSLGRIDAAITDYDAAIKLKPLSRWLSIIAASCTA